MDMLNKYPDIWIDGVSASSLGIRLQGPLQLDPLTPRVDVISVPGRNGDVINSDGSFANRRARVTAYVYRPDFVQKSLGVIYKWIFGASTYRELVSSGDLEHYYRARVVNGGEVSDKIGKLLPFTIEFDCEPIRYSRDAEEYIEIPMGAGIYNASTVNAYPIYKIYYRNFPDHWVGQPLVMAHIFLRDSSNEDVGEIGIQIRSAPTASSGTVIFDSKTFGSEFSPDAATHPLRVVSSNGAPLTPGVQFFYWGDTIEKIEMIPRWCEL